MSAFPVLLVRPRPDPETIGLQHVMLVEPLELEVLAGLCRPDAQPTVVDLTLETREIEDFLAEVRPRVLGVTGYISNVPAMIDLCRRAKAFDPGIATVVGGVHCEVCPGDLDDPAVDFRVVRNAVTAFPRLLEHVRAEAGLPPGVLGPGERCVWPALPPMDFRWAPPDRASTDRYRDRYFYIFHDRVALLKTSFGCPYQCTFCFCRQITAGAYRERPLDDVLDELQALPQREIYLVDDDFLVSRRRVQRFVEHVRMRGIDKHYLLYGRADFIARNRDLLADFRAVGLRTVIVGFESFLDRDLDAYGKGSDAGTNAAAMRVLNDLDIECFATVILGPDWSREDFRVTGRRLAELGVRFVNLQPLTPLPGTEVSVPDTDLVLDRRDFAKWDLAHVAVKPTKMTVAEYYRELMRLYFVTLYRPAALLRHAAQPPRMIAKMLAGTARVTMQYRRKLLAAM